MLTEGWRVGPLDGDAEVDGARLACNVGFTDFDGKFDGTSLGMPLSVGSVLGCCEGAALSEGC